MGCRKGSEPVGRFLLNPAAVRLFGEPGVPIESRVVIGTPSTQEPPLSTRGGGRLTITTRRKFQDNHTSVNVKLLRDIPLLDPVSP